MNLENVLENIGADVQKYQELLETNKTYKEVTELFFKMFDYDIPGGFIEVLSKFGKHKSVATFLRFEQRHETRYSAGRIIALDLIDKGIVNQVLPDVKFDDRVEKFIKLMYQYPNINRKNLLKRLNDEMLKKNNSEKDSNKYIISSEYLEPSFEHKSPLKQMVLIKRPKKEFKPNVKHTPIKFPYNYEELIAKEMEENPYKSLLPNLDEELYKAANKVNATLRVVTRLRNKQQN